MWRYYKKFLLIYIQRMALTIFTHQKESKSLSSVNKDLGKVFFIIHPPSSWVEGGSFFFVR